MRIRPSREMETFTVTKICPETQLSVSYAYKKGCRCEACRANKARYTAKDTKAAERARIWRANLTPEQRKEVDKRVVKKSKERQESKYLQNRKKYGDSCNICGTPAQEVSMSNSRNKLVLDHCHRTGKIRGLLCGCCNVGLGHFKDNPKLLEIAIDYLQKNGDVYES